MVATTAVVVTICPIGVPDVEDAPLYFQPVEVGVAVAVDLMVLAASVAVVSVVLAVVALVVAEPEEAGKT